MAILKYVKRHFNLVYLTMLKGDPDWVHELWHYKDVPEELYARAYKDDDVNHLIIKDWLQFFMQTLKAIGNPNQPWATPTRKQEFAIGMGLRCLV